MPSLQGLRAGRPDVPLPSPRDRVYRPPHVRGRGRTPSASQRSPRRESDGGVGFVQDPADLGGRLPCLSRVARFGSVLPPAEVRCHVGLTLDVDIGGPLGDEPLERCQVGALPGLVGRLVQLPCEGRQRCGRDLADRLSQCGNRGRGLGNEWLPSAEVVMATPMGVILIPCVSVSGASALPPLERVRERRCDYPRLDRAGGSVLLLRDFRGVRDPGAACWTPATPCRTAEPPSAGRPVIPSDAPPRTHPAAAPTAGGCRPPCRPGGRGRRVRGGVGGSGRRGRAGRRRGPRR